MRGEVETMVTALVLEERLSRGNDARWIDHILPKMQIKPQMSGASWWNGIRKMELRKSRRCESATTGRQTHTFEHLAVKKTPSRVFVL
jgi:hypothetical protein